MADRVELPPLPPSVAMLPLLFMGGARSDPDRDLNLAVAAAVAAELAILEPRSSRRRIAYLLCELAQQYGRRCGDHARPVPVSLDAIARALGLSRARVKRVIALLTLSGEIEGGEETIRVCDWRRLAAAAGYDAGRLRVLMLPAEAELEEEGEDEEPLAYIRIASSDDDSEDASPNLLTRTGEPAYFG